ncbi:MAG: thioredoxin-disulfide reductase [Candidatus Marsarchaeota archaeon]|jgi:thioredoxin reductase (NADPH)|nr:thioredoxin-disulfide reductase [Candidatus Marsarchaeota archaeon]
MVEKVVILGSGPAGLTAALYAARDDLKPIIIGGFNAGGQLMLTTEVENYPGFPSGIYGAELIDNMRKQAEKFGAIFVNDDVKEVNFNSSPFKLKTSTEVFDAHSVIIATGASAKWLGLESEKKFIGKGISSCATCDAAFFRNKEVAVVGGGDTALEDAIFLTKFATKVHIIHRREEFKASRLAQDRVKANPKIDLILNSEVIEILGESSVTGAKIRNNKTNKITEIKIDGLFVAIGYKPNTDFLKEAIKLDEQGYIIVSDEVKTNIDGIFVAGDVADKIYKQAVIAAGAGAKAALEVRFYLQKKNII